jgi:prevent-host-death family protein
VIDNQTKQRHYGYMKTANISELRDRLSRYLDHVKAGGRVVILDRNRPVAQIVPVGTAGEAAPGTDQGRLEALEREGIIRRGSGKLPPGFLRGVLPGQGARVLKALLDERRTGR